LYAFGPEYSFLGGKVERSIFLLKFSVSKEDSNS
jgi:hypothetical protein